MRVSYTTGKQQATFLVDIICPEPVSRLDQSHFVIGNWFHLVPSLCCVILQIPALATVLDYHTDSSLSLGNSDHWQHWHPFL